MLMHDRIPHISCPRYGIAPAIGCNEYIVEASGVGYYGLDELDSQNITDIVKSLHISAEKRQEVCR